MNKIFHVNQSVTNFVFLIKENGLPANLSNVSYSQAKFRHESKQLADASACVFYTDGTDGKLKFSDDVYDRISLNQSGMWEVQLDILIQPDTTFSTNIVQVHVQDTYPVAPEE